MLKGKSMSTKPLILIALVLLALIPSRVLAAEPETIFFTQEYSFDYQSNPQAPGIAQALCGTRCNALSGNYDSYLSPGSWRLIQIGRHVKKVVDLDNPFFAGKCICIGDLYKVGKENVFNEPQGK